MQDSTTAILYDFIEGISPKYLDVKYGQWHFPLCKVKVHYGSEVLLHVRGRLRCI